MKKNGASSGSSPSVNHGAPPPPPAAAASITITEKSNDNLISTETTTPAREASDGSRPKQNLVSSPGDTTALPAASTKTAHDLIGTDITEIGTHSSQVANQRGVEAAPNSPNPSVGREDPQPPAGTDTGTGTGAGAGTGTGTGPGPGSGAVGAGPSSANHRIVENDPHHQRTPKASTSTPQAVIKTDTVSLPGNRGRR